MPQVDSHGVGPCCHDYRVGEGRCWFCGHERTKDEKDKAESTTSSTTSALDRLSQLMDGARAGVSDGTWTTKDEADYQAGVQDAIDQISANRRAEREGKPTR